MVKLKMHLYSPFFVLYPGPGEDRKAKADGGGVYAVKRVRKLELVFRGKVAAPGQKFIEHAFVYVPIALRVGVRKSVAAYFRGQTQVISP
jgi:hypothetical protein